MISCTWLSTVGNFFALIYFTTRPYQINVSVMEAAIPFEVKLAAQPPAAVCDQSTVGAHAPTHVRVQVTGVNIIMLTLLFTMNENDTFSDMAAVLDNQDLKDIKARARG